MKEKGKCIRIKNYDELIKKFETPLRWNTEYLFVDQPLNNYKDFTEIQKSFIRLIEIGRYKGIDVCPAIIIRKMKRQKKSILDERTEIIMNKAKAVK